MTAHIDFSKRPGGEPPPNVEGAACGKGDTASQQERGHPVHVAPLSPPIRGLKEWMDALNVERSF